MLLLELAAAYVAVYLLQCLRMLSSKFNILLMIFGWAIMSFLSTKSASNDSSGGSSDPEDIVTVVVNFNYFEMYDAEASHDFCEFPGKVFLFINVNRVVDGNLVTTLLVFEVPLDDVMASAQLYSQCDEQILVLLVVQAYNASTHELVVEASAYVAEVSTLTARFYD